MNIPSFYLQSLSVYKVFGQRVWFLITPLLLLVSFYFQSYFLAGFLLLLLSFHFFARFKSTPQLQESLSEVDFSRLYLAFEPSSLLALAKVKTTRELYEKIYDLREAKFIAIRLGLPQTLYSDLFLKSQELNESYYKTVFDLAIKLSDPYLHAGHLLAALILWAREMQIVLRAFDLKPEDIENVAYWQSRILKEENLLKTAWQRARIHSGGGLALEWATSATYILDQLSYDLSRPFEEGRFRIHLYGRSREIERLEEVLAKSSGANAVLVGEEGVGKRTIILGLAQKIAQHKTLPSLEYKRIRELNISALLAGASGSREVEARLIQVFNETAKAGNLILFIDNIVSLFADSNKEFALGKINASEILIPYLKHSALHIVGTATPADYRLIENNALVRGLLQKVEVERPSLKDTLLILEETCFYIESKHRLAISYKALVRVVELADRYIHDIPLPESAITLLEEAAIEASAQGITFLTAKMVEDVLEKKTKVKVGTAVGEERAKLLNLESYLHQRIVGQDEAIRAVANAMRRARAGLERGNKPIGSFLFVGPTGVGKTETAKALAEFYFGSEEAMVRLDMSEYQTPEGVARLIGSESTPGLLTEAVRNKPFTLLLLDEFEKCYPNIRDLFLQVLDDGRLTDYQGRLIDFRNTIIIATSNAGAEKIREAILANKSFLELKKEIIDLLLSTKAFKPELLNRFDEVILFLPLTLEEVKEVVRLMLKKLEDSLRDRAITLKLTEPAVEKLTREGYDPTMGARNLERLLKAKVEDLLARKILAGELSKGSTLIIDEDII